LNSIDLIEGWKQEEAQPFSGWDFSYLEGRMIEEQPPWSYSVRAAELMDNLPDRKTASLLDMGTGGGEKLLSLQVHWPGKVAVTEDYPPNVQLARERLEPLGVSVEEVVLSDDGLMPFADGEFNLVLNRHSGLNPVEVARILAPGGIFLTQQIHGLWAQDLVAFFDAELQFAHISPQYYLPPLQNAGLLIINWQDWQGLLTFTDVGALVYYLKAIPWTVPGFSVESHLEYLLHLQEKIEAKGELVFEARKFLIEAYKPLVGDESA
jgi:SAM-dependent methyltransferase